MRKILCFLLIICLFLSSFGGVTTAFAEEKEYFSYDHTPIAEKYSAIHYYEFKNPIKVASDKNYIAVLDYDATTEKTNLISFDVNGKYLSTTQFKDPRDVEIVGGYAYVLDYDLKAETPTAHIYVVDMRAGTASITLKDVIAKDIASYDNSLYVLNVGLIQGVKRFTATSTGLIHDTSFSDNGLFANATAIACSANYILGYQSNIGIPTIFGINLNDGKKTDVTSLPSGGMNEFLFDGTNLYILNEKGVFVGNLSSAPDFVPAMLVDTEKTSSSENLINPISFTLDKNSTNSILVLDNKNALAVKKFKYSSKILTSGMFSIGSFSSDVGAFNTPTDVSFSNGKTFYADNQNGRIVMVSKSGKTTEFVPLDSNNKPIKPKFVGADYSSNIYVATENAVYKYSSSFKLIKEYTRADDRKFNEISSLFVSDVSDEVYVIDGPRLICLDTEVDEFKILKPSGSSSSALTIDMRFQRAIIANETTVYVYDLNNLESRFQSFQVGSNASFVIKDLKVDFDGSIYALVGNSSFSYIFKYAINEKGRYEPVGQVRLGSEVTFKAMAVDDENSRIYLLPTTEHRAYLLDVDAYRDLEIAYYYNIDISTNIFDQTYDEKATVGTVKEFSNKMIFPLNSYDSLYPVNYAITRARKLKTGEKVVVAGYTKDNKFAYVICNNAAGFMDVEALSVSDQLTDMPFKQGVALHDNMYVYKYPLVTVYDLMPLYSIDQVAKDTKMTILNKASDYISPQGLYWYKVTYVKDGKIKFGYVPRYNLVEDLQITNPTLEYGKIDSKVLHGTVEVFADLGMTPIGRELLDNTEIIILSTTDKFAYIQEVTENGDGIVGYVLKENITTQAQTKSQQTALILIAVLIFVIILLIVFRIVWKKIKRNR